MKIPMTRRYFVHAVPAAALVVAAGLARPSMASGSLQPTPDVGRGPNHRRGAPIRNKLSPEGAIGRVIVISGHVRASDSGAPLEGAILDAFHADANGVYDLDGFDYRGRVKTDARGRFEFETIRPQGYSGLRAHIHFVITHPGYRTISTELRFDDGRPDAARADFPRALVTDLVERNVDGRTVETGTFEVALAPE